MKRTFTDSIPASKEQIMKMGYLCTRLKMHKDDIEEMVYMHTGGRATSRSKMYMHEARTVIAVLVDTSDEMPDERDKMRRKVLSMAHEMHWEQPDGRVDYERLDIWCMKHTGQKKPFKALSYSELNKVVTGFTNVYTSFLKGI